MRSHWPYPRVLAHRGAGVLAPENTLAAMAAGFALGYRAVEFDVMLTADKVPVLMHDVSFGRTVRGPGSVPTSSAAELTLMDAGSWFGPQFADQHPPLFRDVLLFCRGHGIFMNIEIKPAPGDEEETGVVVASMAEALFGDAQFVDQRPLLSSFSTVSLAAARDAGTRLPRGLLVDRIPHDWAAQVTQLGCSTLHCNHEHLDFSLIEAIRDRGLGIMCYTVNERERAVELMRAGVDAICTDRLDRLPADLADD